MSRTYRKKYNPLRDLSSNEKIEEVKETTKEIAVSVIAIVAELDCIIVVRTKEHKIHINKNKIHVHHIIQWAPCSSGH